MTVQTSTNVASFNGDAANKVFPIGYKFNSAADLVVVLLDHQAKTTQILTLNSDYTVTGAGDEEGGVVTLAVAPTSVQRLKVTRVVDILQLTDLRNQGKFYAEIHEDVFDLLIMIDQQQQTEIDDANAKSDEAVTTANAANAKSDQAVAKAAQNLVDMQAQYDAFEQGASFVVIGDYAAGLVVDGYNKVFRKDGEFYRAKAETTLPYPLNGDWAVDAPKFVSVGDAVLREDLTDPVSPESGAAILGRGVVAVRSIESMLLSKRDASLRYLVLGYSDGSTDGGGEFYWDAESATAHDGIFTFEVPGVAVGRFKRVTQSVSLFDMGVPVVDDVMTADQTDVVIEALGRLPDSFKGVIRAEAGNKFVYERVVPHLPLGVFLELAGAQAGHLSADYRMKIFGLVTNDTVPDDTKFTITSPHHPAIELCNTLQHDNPNGLPGRSSLLWRCYSEDHGSQGRVNAMLQFAGDRSAAGKWGLSLISICPWQAVARGYSEWGAGKAVSVGAIVHRSHKFYEAETSGTTGNTPPSHSFGSVSDGGVTWRILLVTDSTRFDLEENGHMAIGRGGASAATLAVRAPHEEDNAIIHLDASETVGGYCEIRGIARTAAGAVAFAPILRFNADGVTSLQPVGSTKRLISADNEGAFWQAKKHLDSVVTGATPDVAGKYSIQMAPSAALTVTNFTNAVADQEIQVMNTGTANLTLSGGGFSLTGGSAVITPWSVITLRKVTANSGRWVEISRSIK